MTVLAHGSGTSRLNPRNRFVAEVLREGGLATLSIDLLTLDEESVDVGPEHRLFDSWLFAERLIGATDWLAANPATRSLKVGYYGTNTAGCAALVAAAERPERVGAVVSRGGFPDLAGPSLPAVRAATLLIVGAEDEPLIAINREALQQLRSERCMEVVGGASHLFEEPGASKRSQSWPTDGSNNICDGSLPATGKHSSTT